MLNDCTVQYVCAGGMAPLAQLFFCRHCVAVRSKNCVLHEVDSSFCTNCLENMTPADAKIKKNRCKNCFDCPSCGKILTTRIMLQTISTSSDSSSQAEKLDSLSKGEKTENTIAQGADDGTQKKSYYLACPYCRWTTRDSAIPDSSCANGLQERKSLNLPRVAQLIDYYREMAIEEIQEKEKKRSRRRSYFQSAEKHGYGPFGFKQRSKIHQENNNTDFVAGISSSTTEELSDEFFQRNVVLEEETNIMQRLLDVEYQPTQIISLFPQRKMVQVKQSQRCKYCEHNLIKPEYTAASFKFKINLSAMFHIPEIKIMSKPVLKPAQENKIILVLRNPLDHQLQVSFTPLPDNDTYVNAKVTLPSEELCVKMINEVTGLDYSQIQAPSPEDDPRVIAFRRGNKIGFYATVIPNEISGNVTIGFEMQHNIQIPIDRQVKEMATKILTHKIIIDLGMLEGLKIPEIPQTQSPKQRLGTYVSPKEGLVVGDNASVSFQKVEKDKELSSSTPTVSRQESLEAASTPTASDQEGKQELFASVKKLFNFTKANKS